MPRKPVLKPPFLSGGKELYFTIEPTHMPHRVLVIDDDPTFCRMLEDFCREKAWMPKAFFQVRKLAHHGKRNLDIILSDYRLPEKMVLNFDEIREHHGPVLFIIMTSYADIRIAVRAMKPGHMIMLQSLSIRMKFC